MSFNKVILQGRLTAVPELKQTPSGTSVTSFSIAVDRRFDREKTDFFTIVAWKATAEFICKYFTKGSPILVCGELQNRSWTDKQGNKRISTEVVANEASFVDSKSDPEGVSSSANQNASQSEFSAGTAASYIPEAYTAERDDDLPF